MAWTLPDGERTKQKSASVSLKLTVEERDRLHSIAIARERELFELTGQRLQLKPADILRWLIDKEALSRGLLAPTGPATHAKAPPPTVLMPSLGRTMASSLLPTVPVAPPVPLPGSPLHATFTEEPTMISEAEAPPTTPRSQKARSASLVKNPKLLRTRIDNGIGSGKFRQRDVVEASGLPSPDVARFLRGDDLDSKRLRRLGFALVKLQG